MNTNKIKNESKSPKPQFKSLRPKEAPLVADTSGAEMPDASDQEENAELENAKEVFTKNKTKIPGGN